LQAFKKGLTMRPAAQKEEKPKEAA